MRFLVYSHHNKTIKKSAIPYQPDSTLSPITHCEGLLIVIAQFVIEWYLKSKLH